MNDNLREMIKDLEPKKPDGAARNAGDEQTEDIISDIEPSEQPEATKKSTYEIEDGRMIGKVRDNGNIVCLFPDPTLEVIYRHFRSVGQRLPFTKETLRDALIRHDLIIRSSAGRVAHQVRLNGSRLQAWQYDVNQFKSRCGMSDA